MVRQNSQPPPLKMPPPGCPCVINGNERPEGTPNIPGPATADNFAGSQVRAGPLGQRVQIKGNLHAWRTPDPLEEAWAQISSDTPPYGIQNQG